MGVSHARTMRLQERLRDEVRGDVDFSTTARATHSADASIYRHPPLGVVYPVDGADVAAVLALAREFDVALTMRGAGTSIAGQVLGRGLVLDCSRYMSGISEIDPEGHTAWVGPGTVLDELREAAGKHGLTFGPDPSTHSRCTLGGMIGNDSCGSHSVAWGRTADNIEELDVLLADGTRLTVGRTSPEELRRRCAEPGRVGDLYRGLRDLSTANLELLRTGYPRLPRRVSGYALDALLPENGFHLARALVGTEGTCAIVLGARVRLMPAPPVRALVVGGYRSMPAAADAVPDILDVAPLTVEGMGADMVETVLAHAPGGPGPTALDRLPPGRGWLFLEVGGDTASEAEGRAGELATRLEAGTTTGTIVVTDPAEQRKLWSIREAGSGLVTRAPDGTEAWPGWEDAAVPPEQLGRYLEDFQELQRQHNLRGIPYGHFGEGCVHVRLDFDLDTAPGRANFRDFMEAAADLVVSYGGSISGEHGDGQARGELLGRMYPPELVNLFAQFKFLFDPDNLLNPGIGVDPRPLDENVRVSGPARQLPLALPYPHDDGSLAKATRRCVGVGTCVDTSSGVMCPSYMVTGQEEHSTRGRARLLGEMLRGEIITDGWDSTEVREALDLCLSCKGCLSDCPVNVDMATYKSEFLHQHYRRRIRPVTHYSLGALPLWLRLAAPLAPQANGMAQTRWAGNLVKRMAGIAAQRELPTLAETTFLRAFHRRRRAAGPSRATGGSGRAGTTVLLWPDTFTNYLEPRIGAAATEVLEHAGFTVIVPRNPVCCGLTWVTTGQLNVARAVMRHTVRTLAAPLRAGVPVVGLEPSCTSVLRGELPEYLSAASENADVAAWATQLGQQTHTLAGFLNEYAPDAEFGNLDVDAITQVHCHQHATLGFSAEERLMERVGLHNRTLDAGCCGLAGNFGFEDGHYEVSVGAAERRLLPEMRAATPDTAVLADGYSCRTQIEQLGDRRAQHLAEVLRTAIPT
ncbi:FAD-binding and (Fe-S)-binding domain-containing protein [Lipingzhangella sp. LS1_29]|uniref:FAD-binding and (Fe-S)-binding domain-containing protein n=1 Tax=Lipingzhangella rawalii TaxID=2055835 RepID=A0ABU2H0H7_9ACTN|nr:FAD-binding and (Fe-S)-binding domain-containing protein [Lipingzhangella rawalii]MDS1268806.1 FAD-binding and (Fe-S)-binding domain-containing protein [Lipingzhangella rawalii]